MRQLLRSLTLLFASLLLLTSMATPALAASSSSATNPNGYRVSPVRTDLTVSPGATSIVPVYVQNASAAVEHVQVIVNDFEAPTNETGQPELLLNGATAPTHSLKQFVTVAEPTFTLQPGQQMTANIIIKVPAGSAGGGYYGAVRFAPSSLNGDKNVNLSASVASLILLTVPGNLIEQVSIVGFGVAQGKSTTTRSFFFSNKNLNAITRFQNSGNVQEQPIGKVVLKKGAQQLYTASVNNVDSPGNVLPSSIRLFSTQLNKVGWFGKYTLESYFTYGSKGQLLTASASFYVIPVLIIILVILLILLIIFLIFGLPRLIRAYNRRVIARASRQTNPHHPRQ
jgi:WxL interacting protein linking bacterial and host surfaces